MENRENIISLDALSLNDLPLVGGKNANLGEMITHLCNVGIRVPGGFAITINVYQQFLLNNRLDKVIAQALAQWQSGEKKLSEIGETIRTAVGAGEFSQLQRSEITDAYQARFLSAGHAVVPVAVRSSATAEDLPEASFAGQQESYLNVCGVDALLERCRDCYASLYTDRAIAYREAQGFTNRQIALSIAVQQMVEAQSAGVMFTLDTATGFPDAILINAAWGLGETVVKGSVNPDRYMVYKPLLENPNLSPLIEKSRGSNKCKMVFASADRCGIDSTETDSTETDASEKNLVGPENHSVQSNSTKTVATSVAEQSRYVLSDEDILSLSRWALSIEKHYQRFMDIEWVKAADGLYVVQARPETVESNADRDVLLNYRLKQSGRQLVEGASVGKAVASGIVCVLDSPAAAEDFPDNAILVAHRTDPDWVPLMRRAAGLITDVGGPTSHAAIVSRELSLAAVVGTGNATQVLGTGDAVTLDCCSEGAVGRVYQGCLDYEVQRISLADIPVTHTQVMINAAIPDAAMRWWALPVDGIGLVRIEFIISAQIGVHPMALLHPERVRERLLVDKINTLVSGFTQATDFFVENLALGIAKIAASRYPQPVIVRMSDFKSNEYRDLLGGEYFERKEENPMLGLRGASRYYDRTYREAFVLECEAIKRTRELMGFDNVIVMIPFCRTPEEADRVLDEMSAVGLQRGKGGLQVYMMCEIPANIILAEQFAQRFDGFSIGTNDLTQLVLGIDRDSAELEPLFDARNEAVKRLIAQLIPMAHEQGCKVGICGQAPSDYPDFAEFLVECGIDSISLNPDSVVDIKHHIAAVEKRLGFSD